MRQMSNGMGISLTAAGINIDGVYYALVNGYLSKKQERIYIAYNDLLAAEYVRCRSKKLMVAFALVGSIVGFAFAYIHLLANAFGFIVMLSVACLLAFMISSRAYIEITFAGGAIRVPCGSMRKSAALQFVQEIWQGKEQILQERQTKF